MAQHAFLLSAGEWLGEGEVSFSASPESMKYHTLWRIQDDGEGVMTIQHKVELAGVSDQVENKLTVSDATDSRFAVQLSNDMVTKVDGTGVIEEKRIAWEFKDRPGFEGFEIYDLQEDGGYTVHAEYLSSDQFRTIIKGRIWPRATKGGE